MSAQCLEGADSQELRNIAKKLLEDTLPWKVDDNKFFFNPAGKFTIGGPEADTGLTGRKIVVDTYGGSAPHGGGAFSGKDPSKVDRSAAYMARYIAKNIVAGGWADRFLIQLSYGIGMFQPTSVYINTFGTNTVSSDKILQAIKKSLDLSPRGIIEYLKLDRPIYSNTSAYGHFGRESTPDGCFSWEKLDLIDTLKQYLD